MVLRAPSHPASRRSDLSRGAGWKRFPWTPRSAGSWPVAEPTDALGVEPVQPLPHRLRVAAQPLGDLGGAQAVPATRDHRRASDPVAGRVPGAGQLADGPLFGGADRWSGKQQDGHGGSLLGAHHHTTVYTSTPPIPTLRNVALGTQSQRLVDRIPGLQEIAGGQSGDAAWNPERAQEAVNAVLSGLSNAEDQVGKAQARCHDAVRRVRAEAGAERFEGVQGRLRERLRDDEEVLMALPS